MEFIRQMGGVALLCIGLMIAIGNWSVFIGAIKRRKSASFGPLVGGICLFIALMIPPFNFSWKVALLGFVVDFGSLPLFSYGVFMMIRSRITKKNETETDGRIS